jgi:2,4-dienoyl-CoA reductase-like NADH-dependent reductase (Old Yellow Enzyme family)/thioredoxin reductase
MTYKKVNLKRLFEQASIGKMDVKNRIIMAPMGTRLSSEVGGVTQRQIEYYAERAKGGVGTIITEVVCVDYPLGLTGPTNLCIHDNAYIAGHNELVEAVHTYGAKIICQLVHAGRQTRPSSIKGMDPVAPSAIPCKFLNVMPRELTTSETEDIVRKFIEAAVRVKTAGYDGLELHGAHGYLIAQFMSPESNRRKDRYGGDLMGRMTFPLEIIQGIRKELGRDFPLLFRFSGDEFVDGGRDLEESKEVARILEEAGVDALHVSAGTYDSMPQMIEPMSYEEGWKIYLAEAIKKVVKIPVIGVGAIRTPQIAEKILQEKKVDFIALGRALLADPYWPEKAKEGRVREIIPCISCNVGCIGERIFRNLHIRCAVNPLTGREGWKDTLVPAIKKKKVFVIGGGPAGMTAAIYAKMRGHDVTLYEKGKELGGQLRLAEVPPGKEKIAWFREYLINLVKERRIKVHLGTNVYPKMIAQRNPDAVIIATGATPFIPEIPGVKSRSVFTAWDILEGKRKVKGKVVLVAGGGTVGCETALFLANENRKVIMVEMLDALALDMEPINRIEILSRIEKAGIDVILKRKIHEIEPDGVVVSTEDKKREKIEADIVVLALGAFALRELSGRLYGKVKEIHIVGDANSPRKIMDAVYEGFQAAIRI